MAASFVGEALRPWRLVLPKWGNAWSRAGDAAPSNPLTAQGKTTARLLLCIKHRRQVALGNGASRVFARYVRQYDHLIIVGSLMAYFLRFGRTLFASAIRIS
jgi:hypothetical protein